MSKRFRQIKTTEPAPEVVHKPPEKVKIIPRYRRCPVCWGDRESEIPTGYGGVGECKSTQGVIRYYRCERSINLGPGCGHNWKETISPAEVLSERASDA